MSKKKKIGIIILVSFLLVGAGGYLVYTKLTDYVIASMFETILVEELEEQGVHVSDEVSTVPTGQSQEVIDTQTKATNPTKEKDPTKELVERTNDPEKPHETQGQTTDKENGKAEVVVAKVDIEKRVKEIVKSIPVRDKNAVMRLIAQNISSSDIRYLSSLVADGNISGSDIAKAKEVAIRSFTPKQLEDVRYYYYKYIGMFSELYN